MAPWMTIFLYKQVVFTFHSTSARILGECISFDRSRNVILEALPALVEYRPTYFIFF